MRFSSSPHAQQKNLPAIPGKRSADPASIEGRRSLRWIADRRGFAACPDDGEARKETISLRLKSNTKNRGTQ
jgi:hypothetical protein